MIDEFWRFYSQLRFAYRYHQIRRNRLVQWMKYISIVSYTITAISVAGWAVTGKFAAVWSAIILVSQVANGLKDLLDWSKKEFMLSAYLTDLNETILDFEKSWRQIMLGQLTEEKILQRINSGNEQYRKLECCYILQCNLMESTLAIKKADKMTNAELEALHGKGDDKNERQLEA